MNKLNYYYKCQSIKSQVKVLMIMESIQKEVQDALLGLSEINHSSIKNRLINVEKIEKKQNDSMFCIFKKITGKNKF